MFKKFIENIKKVVSIILPKKEVGEKLDIDIKISKEMQEAIELWKNMYEETSYWLTEDNMQSLNIPSSIASEIARLTTIEMESNITGGVDKNEEEVRNERSEFLDKNYQKVIDNLRVQLEYACAKGGIVLKPYIDNENIAIEFIQADEFYPVAFNSSGELIGVIFPDIIERGGAVYTRLEYHHLLSDGTYYISNTSYIKEASVEGIGVPCELSSIEEWEDLEPEMNIPNLEETLFTYLKMPLANNKDSKSHLGVSVYSKSEKLIKEVDSLYSSILWEYEGTELAIDVGVDLFKMGTELPKKSDRLYRKLDSDTEEPFYNVFSPDIRDESLFNGLNKMLQRIEFNCGLAYGTLSDIQVVEKTAEEIKTSKQRSYSTIVDIQKSLRISLEHLIRIMEYYTDLYKLAPKGDIEVSFNFDDSIIIDSKTEQAIMLQEVSAGLIKPEKYLMSRYGVTEKQALEMLPDMNLEVKEEDYDDLE